MVRRNEEGEKLPTHQSYRASSLARNDLHALALHRSTSSKNGHNAKNRALRLRKIKLPKTRFFVLLSWRHILTTLFETFLGDDDIQI